MNTIKYGKENMDGLSSHLGDIGSESILDASISTADLENSIITSAKLATDAVETAKIKNVNVTSAKIASSAVTNAKLDTSACSGTKVDSTVGIVGIGSPSTYGNIIQAGNVTTGAGSSGTIEFGNQFANTSWYGILTGGSETTGNQAYISGTRNISGAEIVGEASITYDYLAIGAK